MNDAPIIHPDALWGVSSIARFADYSYSKVVRDIVPREDFPKPIRVTDGCQPRWIAGEVIAWFHARRVSSPAH